MTRLRSALLLALGFPPALSPPVAGQTTATAPAPASRTIFLDRQGVMRWQDDRREVALFGANYVITTASDYRAAGYVHGDRREMITEDMAQFARMGWDGLRLTFWGDWEASDSAGNLIANDHLDLLDWLVARARERGIYLLLSPIQLYGSNWPDALADTTQPGFGRHFGKARIGTDPAAVAAQVNYLQQLLRHVNRYTGVALKDEPAILFIELVNEPWHHPEDLAGSVRYINALTGAVRSTGCRKLVFYNVSQDFRIGEAIRQSRAQGVTFGWYPTGLNSGHELAGNYLRGVDAYPDMLRPELSGMPRIVYEFDSPDLRTGTMYPAMARTFRAVGAQFAAMFAYDMLQTASRNLGWQTHYLNLVYTPRKALSAVVAAEAMRRLPRMQQYGPYPANTRFGDFRVSPEENLGELVARDAFIYAGSTRSTPPDPGALTRVAGYGSSPVVRYDGDGAYFLDRIRPGVWRLELYPDAVPVRDPFEPPSAEKIVTRAISRAWPMTVSLPGLGDTFLAQPIAAGNRAAVRASGGRFEARPGVYLLSPDGPIDPSTLPAFVGHIGLREYHPPPDEPLPPSVEPLSGPSLPAGQEGVLRVRVADSIPPDSLRLYLRPAAGGFYRGFALSPGAGYDYSATIPAAALAEGPHRYVVTLFRGSTRITFPGSVAEVPGEWNYDDRVSWALDAVGPAAPLELFTPATDAGRMAFTRIGDAGRLGMFRVGLSHDTGRPVFHMELPVTPSGWSPPDYTASLVVRDRIVARGSENGQADRLVLRLRGLGPRQRLHLALMEDDGTAWTAELPVDSGWSEVALPLDGLVPGRGVLLPEGFPGEWNYWVEPAMGRGSAGDHLRLARLERLQFSLRPEAGVAVPPGGYGVEVEWVRLERGER